MIDFSIYRKYDLNPITNIPNCCGIYCFRNNINNKCYIGQALNIKRRIRGHMAKIADRVLIHKALRKYGINNFSFYIIEEGLTKEQLNNREVYWITFFDSYKNGYNMTPGGGQPASITEETREKMQNTVLCKKVIAYNYKYNYYMECKSVRQLARIFKAKKINISAQNIYDAKLNKSYSKDFIFGDTVSDIQYILKNKKLPKDINIYLYNISTKEYSPVFHTTKDATEYIKSLGTKISDSYVSVALQKNSKFIKNFIIASSREELEDKINAYHPHLFCYDPTNYKFYKFKNIKEASKYLNCCYVDVKKCLNKEFYSSKGFYFGYTKEECIKAMEQKIRKLVDKAYKKYCEL